MTASSKTGSRRSARLQTLGFTLSVTLVFGSGVSLVHVLTQARVRQNEALHLRRAVRAAAGLPALPDSDLPAWFDATVEKVEPLHYRVRKPGNADAELHVVVRSGAGLWGQIRMAVGVDTSGAEPRLIGAAILAQNETPGLGARIAEPWFTAQLRGKGGVLRLVPEGTKSDQPDTIDAITGATITSVAVRDLLNQVLSRDSVPSMPERRTSDGHDERR